MDRWSIPHGAPPHRAVEAPEPLAPRCPSRRHEDPAPLLAEAFHGGYRRLVVQLYLATGDLTEAEHLVQDAYVRAASAPARFAAAPDLETWLRTNALRRHHRRVHRARAWLRTRRAAASVRPADLHGPDDHLDAHVDAVQALRRLPPRQREVLALHDLVELPVARVADALGVSAWTVESRLQQARTTLNRVLEASDGVPSSP